MHKEEIFESADLVAFSRRKDIRVAVNVSGRYTLSTRRAPDGNLREFACRALNMTPNGVYLAAAIHGPAGDRVVAHLDQFGKLAGRIAHLARDGFGVQLTLSAQERAALAAKLVWFQSYRQAEVSDKREHDRFVPKSPLATLTFGSGQRLSCFIIDMSSSGVAVSADLVPHVGMPLAVGSVVGRVVRIFSEGFAVQFIEEQERSLVESRVCAKIH